MVGRGAWEAARGASPRAAGGGGGSGEAGGRQLIGGPRQGFILSEGPFQSLLTRNGSETVSGQVDRTVRGGRTGIGGTFEHRYRGGNILQADARGVEHEN